ncbi:hypothetical protein BEL04_14335 [Mucilaginibacter sp. PPCGB 2223]|uniref:hypothetical protein n=1 Tax=Mucilaginibacter sp. PPCGB 2223 TaxID=1886027 RepID=UPI00082418E3|nr:hypothetical protein [Mucilaginibacter sp. PPCGB 2223]OCX52623.1 hypothetical protein BEL04_14335 [Mucilaginibacter sp. PPCGB 2223]
MIYSPDGTGDTRDQNANGGAIRTKKEWQNPAIIIIANNPILATKQFVTFHEFTLVQNPTAPNYFSNPAKTLRTQSTPGVFLS